MVCVVPGVGWNDPRAKNHCRLERARVCWNIVTPQTDDLYDLYDLYDLFPLDDLDLSGKIDLYDLYDLYDLAHVAGWQPYDLHDLPGHISWVGYALYKPSTISRNGGLGCRLSRS